LELLVGFMYCILSQLVCLRKLSPRIEEQRNEYVQYEGGNNRLAYRPESVKILLWQGDYVTRDY
jgi:hypothetical protein